MQYYELPVEKYMYYECYLNKKSEFSYFVNDDPLVQPCFLNSTIIPISRYIPSCLHGTILRYYYNRK